MNREVHVRFWERAEVQFLRATRHELPLGAAAERVRYAPKSRLYLNRQRRLRRAKALNRFAIPAL